MNYIYLLYACDEWKSKKSKSLIMATTNSEDILNQINEELSNEDMELENNSTFCLEECFLNIHSNINEVNTNLKYGILEIVVDGEVL